MSGTVDWSIYVLASDGVTWVLNDSFPRPNQDLDKTVTTGIQVIKLANGGEAFVIPEIRRSKEIMAFFWADTTAAFRADLEGYINFGEKIKIVTHSGEVFVGYLMAYRRIWFTGMTDTYDVAVDFKPTE